MDPTSHPLAEIVAAAADGHFPPADGGWHRVPPWHADVEAVVSFTGHSVFAIADDIPDSYLDELGADGFGGANDPRLVAALAGPDAWIDSLDVLLVARGRPDATPALVERPDLADHSRVRFAAAVRHDPRVLGYQDRRRTAVATLSKGLAGVTELSFELEPEHRGAHGATAFIRSALAVLEPGELVVAASAPGNAASVRALLSAGFVAIGSVQLLRRARGEVKSD